MPEQRDPEQSDPESVLDETVAFWEPIAGRKLSREDARQIREDLAGFFRVLIEWDEAEKARDPEHTAEGRGA